MSIAPMGHEINLGGSQFQDDDFEVEPTHVVKEAVERRRRWKAHAGRKGLVLRVAGPLDYVPQELRTLDQWVVWKRVEKEGGDVVKLPWRADGSGRAKTNDPETWTTYEAAADALTKAGQEELAGVGFVFTDDDPYVGIDFDGCLDEQGRVVEWARPWLNRLKGCHVEVSPSGRGVKAWCRGRLPDGKSLRWKPSNGGAHEGIEVYDRGRYFCVTGERFGPWRDHAIPDRQDVLADLAKLVEGESSKPTPETVETPSRFTRKVKGGDRIEAHALKALEAETTLVASTGEGKRNQQLFQSAAALYELVNAGSLDVATVDVRLTEAARASGLGDSEIQTTLRSARSKTEGKARDVSHVGSGNKTDDVVDAATGIVESVDNDYRLARTILKQRFDHQDGPTLRYWKGEWHVWLRGEWRAIDDKEIVAEAMAVIRAEFEAHAKATKATVRGVGTRLTANVIAALRQLVMLPEAKYPEQPMWLSGEGPTPADCMNFRNGILHLPTLVSQGPEAALLPPTPLYFTSFALDYDFDPAPNRPNNWFAFLDSVWDYEPESIAALQQWFGYLLTSDTSRQKGLMIAGPTRSGKGTIVRVLTKLVGDQNTAAPTMTSLGQQFGLQSLIGKSVAFCNESRLTARSDAPAIVERILSITGEDQQSIDRKHATPWKGRLSVRFVFSANELPRLVDAAQALLTRLVFLRMSRSFAGREDAELESKLAKELPGILFWAIEGWENLQKSGRFIQPESAAESIREMEELTNPLGTFVADKCETGPAMVDVYGEPIKVKTSDLYTAWGSWCQENGRQPRDSTWFGTKLKTALPYVRNSQLRIPGEEGRRQRFYFGIRLRDELCSPF